ncbi:hypothetical protein [Achromobacter denitrificans]|uniref:hypothetical protein n=1 Tax=Achromobacter denitrificans TaxID=32002 RepID=UPI00240CED6F|nr:hypothetical protein [Achromobacter denitrificans]
MTERNTPFPRLAVALAYAFSEERHTLNRPAMARAADMRLGEPGPLSGADGCAEIGKVRQFLERNLNPLHVAVLHARYVSVWRVASIATARRIIPRGWPRCTR